MKKVFVILVVLFVLSMVVTAAVAQEEIDGSRAMPVAGPENFGPSRFDLAAPWGVIDTQDLLPLQLSFGKLLTDVPWAWDINHDNVIDIVDLAMVAARQGCTLVDACYYR